jgi:Flp pilus assembly protein TadD
MPESLRIRNLGLAWAEAGRRLKSWPLLREAAIEGPADPALYTSIAMLLDATGDVDKAARYYRLSLQMDGAQFEALLNLATLLERKGDKREAQALREQAAQMCPRCVSGRSGFSR